MLKQILTILTLFLEINISNSRTIVHSQTFYDGDSVEYLLKIFRVNNTSVSLEAERKGSWRTALTSSNAPYSPSFNDLLYDEEIIYFDQEVNWIRQLP